MSLILLGMLCCFLFLGVLVTILGEIKVISCQFHVDGHNLYYLRAP